LACYAAVRYTRPLAGAFALSSYLARNVEAEAEVTPANRSLPVFAAQGTLDTLVPPARGRELRARLERLGCPVTWREYPMGHELCLEEIGALAAWLAHVLGPG
jgi:phospholipase/carboxylesterase